MNNEQCPICEEGNLTECVEQEPTEYKGVQGETPLYYSVCDGCGSEQGSAEQLRKNKRALTALKKQVDGLLTGDNIKTLRAQYGMTQQQASNIFGGGPVAFSKYEANDVMQSEPMDKLLRVAAKFPDVTSWLALEAGEDSVAQKITSDDISSIKVVRKIS